MFLGRLIRFGIAGGCVTLFHIVIVVSLVETGIAGVAMANGTAFTIAAVTSFLINARFTFHASLASTAFLRFMLVTLVCGGLSVGLAYLVESAGLDYRIGIAVVVAVVPLIAFLLHNFWSFAKH